MLNKVTNNLHDKGINQWSYPWKNETILEDIHNKHIYILLRDHVIIGTFSICVIKNVEMSVMTSEDLYLYRIAIAPEYQGMNIGKEIIDFCCKYASEKKRNLYLDCWNGNKRLREFYMNTGLEYLGDYPEEDYFISIFRYDLVNEGEGFE